MCICSKEEELTEISNILLFLSQDMKPTRKETVAQALVMGCFNMISNSPLLQFWRQVYLLTVLSLILAVFCAQVHPRYLSNDWKLIRMTIFCCVAGISVIPACHWVWLNGGFTSDAVQVRKHRILSCQ